MTIKSSDSINWLQRGKLLAQLGQLQIALDCFDRAILLQEDTDKAQYEKYLTLKELGKNVELICV